MEILREATPLTWAVMKNNMEALAVLAADQRVELGVSGNDFWIVGDTNGNGHSQICETDQRVQLPTARRRGSSLEHQGRFALLCLF